ncbi:hypothetical protein HNQ60_003859 [Povalibacter uvarum]|uniref:Uncharacterized protein n=1 Tax=Povalibacter uvarum TaxID=732238 RepID=A0A841HSI5_9GAMM|nr:hypothetical protein [Povalibacter uvarum]
MPGQLTQLGDALVDVRDVPIDDRVYLAAVAWRLSPKLQQAANLLVFHVEVTAIDDEAQLFNLGACVHPVVAFRSLRFVHQTAALVVANGLDGHIEFTRQHSNLLAFHGISAAA